MKKLSFKLILISVICILFSIGSLASEATGNNIIVSPSTLTGVAGETIPPNSVYVQEVSMTSARLLDVHIVNAQNQVLTKFPKTSGRYFLMDKSTKKTVGYVNLEVTVPKLVLDTSQSLKGEFMFYQPEVGMFDNITNAKDGNLYFCRTNPNPNEKRPLMAYIGFIEGGIYNAIDKIALENNMLKVKF